MKFIVQRQDTQKFITIPVITQKMLVFHDFLIKKKLWREKCVRRVIFWNIIGVEGGLTLT